MDKNHILWHGGGYLLKQLFDEYSNWGNREVSSKYLKISRLVIREAKEDESKKMLLKNYLIQNGLNFKNMCFVDEGWNCSSQIDLTDMFDGKSIGYYFGTFKNKNIHNSSFNGILFSGDGDCIANYEGVFRANLTFIEQICTAPNGSVVGYEESGGKIDAIEKVIDIEKNLYERYTTDIQKIIATNFKMLCAWAPQLNKKKLAYYALKTGLNGEKNIVEKLKYFDNHKYVNVLGNRAINSIDRLGKVKKIIITDVMARPCLYFRYFSKVRLLAMRNRWIQVFYPLIKKVLEVYVSIFIAMERKK